MSLSSLLISVVEYIFATVFFERHISLCKADSACYNKPL